MQASLLLQSTYCIPLRQASSCMHPIVCHTGKPTLCHTCKTHPHATSCIPCSQASPTFNFLYIMQVIPPAGNLQYIPCRQASCRQPTVYHTGSPPPAGNLLCHALAFQVQVSLYCVPYQGSHHTLIS